MSHPGAHRVADDEEDIELSGTQVGIADDDDIIEDHEFEDRGFISGKRNIKKKVASIVRVGFSLVLLRQVYLRLC